MIDEIKQSLEKATQGPWAISALASGYIIADYEPHHVLASVVEYDENGKIHMQFENLIANRHLIANAPEWLQYLLDENERLRKALEEIANMEYSAIKGHTHMLYDSQMIARQALEGKV